MQMEADTEPQVAPAVQRPTGVPRPRPFPLIGTAPGPRCGHTLTTITGPDGDVSKAKLVLFGEFWRGLQGHVARIGAELLWVWLAGGATALEGSSQKNPDGTAPASPGPAASGTANRPSATLNRLVAIYD